MTFGCRPVLQPIVGSHIDGHSDPVSSSLEILNSAELAKLIPPLGHI